MADNDRGQSLISKYVWVIETIHRKQKISFKELNELWLRDDISRGVEIPKRTFDNWRYVIWDMFGINIVNENRGKYRYYIENEEDISKNGLRSWLYNTFCVSNVLANSQSIKDRILLEYVPSGQQYLQPIIEAMKENRVINITYHSYWKDEENNFDVQPYCVKLFRQRWYLVGRSTYLYYYEKGPRIYALDRIKYLHATDETFEMPKDWTAKDFFDGCFGIIAEQSVKIQSVKLKVSAGQANYIRDLKMHESQEEIERNDEYSIFIYYLRPSFDFMQEILWNGEDMEVLEPLWLRKEITGIIKRMWNKYSKKKIIMNMTIGDATLKYLCQKYRNDIGTGTNKFLPSIKVRYVAANKKFGYAYFGNFFFFGDDFYVWEQDDKYAEDHNQDIVQDVFGDECKRRGYARRVIFAGVLTDFADDNGEGIYTGDVIKVMKENEPDKYFAVGAWSHEDGKGEYCFILDNHNWSLEECQRQHYQMTRVGTVFYKLDASDDIGVNQRVMSFNGWRDTEEDRLQKVLMAKYTPNFDQELWKYQGLKILGAEFDWR